MAVFVDNMRAKFGRLILCHMVADTDDELHEMAAKIGIQRSWFQKVPSGNHYDICLSKRALAVKEGAEEITQREAAAFMWHKRHHVLRVHPRDAVRVFKDHLQRVNA